MKWGCGPTLWGTWADSVSSREGTQACLTDDGHSYNSCHPACTCLGEGNTGWHDPGRRSRGTSPPHPTLGIWKPCSSAAHSSASKLVKADPFHGLGGELHELVHTLPPCSQSPEAPCAGQLADFWGSAWEPPGLETAGRERLASP